MSSIMMAVCDTDEGYRERFATYLVERRSEEITVHVFSAPEIFLAIITREAFDIAVLGRGFDETKAAAMEQGVPLLLLEEEPPERATGQSNCSEGESETCVHIFRYQPMEAILHEVQVLTVGRTMASAVGPPNGRMEVIGVYSPMRHEMQLPFTIVLADLLAQKKKTLYVNLMEHAGFLELFGLTGEYDLGDITLRLRNNRLYPEAFLRSVYELERLCYIPPFENPENLHDFSPEDYLAFLAFLEKKTDFEVLVLDFGEGMGKLAKMLGCCTTIYCPMKSGYFFECQINHFLKYADKGAGEALGERLHIVNLPFSAKHIRGGTDVRRQLLWSEFGDYVRAYITGGDV